MYSLAATLLHLVTGEPPAENVSPHQHANWNALPEELRHVLLRGLEPDPEQRCDLPTFLALLREARWKSLTAGLRANIPDAPAVKLQATVAIASATQPEAFRSLQRELLHPDPSAPASDAAVRAGRPLHVVDVALTPPAGRERLFAVWSRAPLPLSPEELLRLTQAGGVSASYRATRNMERVQDSVRRLRREDWHAVVLELDHGGS